MNHGLGGIIHICPPLLQIEMIHVIVQSFIIIQSYYYYDTSIPEHASLSTAYRHHKSCMYVCSFPRHVPHRYIPIGIKSLKFQWKEHLPEVRRYPSYGHTLHIIMMIPT